MQGKKGLVVGIANDQSIAWGCARVFREQGAELAITYQNDKAEPHVRPLAERLQAPIIMPLDVRDEQQHEALFNAIQERWGRLDFVVHSIAFAPKNDLHGRVTDSSLQGFLLAMDVSCHSLIRLVRSAEPLMKDGGAVLAMSYYGAQRVVTNYNIMGPVKAALEAVVRYQAVELGGAGIRVNALSPGPVKTRAASGLKDFDELMRKAAEKAPLHQLLTAEQIGETAAFLVSDRATSLSGQVIHIDGGYNILG
ncbi:MAG: enoyl-[acyl-carrier-protein] reductase FabI [Wenzhouxiangella sp.]|nr:MAG: enoyl-[acyl-carrier-protein] reductase FabI [Wenzhouxiangella sp.]